MSIAGNSTAVGDGPTLLKEQRDTFTVNTKAAVGEAAKTNITGFTANAERPFYVPIGAGGVIAALETLDKQLKESGRVSIFSKKQPVQWTGKEIQPGQLGLINHGGSPKLLTRPGRYPGFPFRNWWARTFAGTRGVSDTVIEFQGLTVVQVSQNQAAVCSNPANQIFVVKDSGFVAFSVEGSYSVLSIVDQTHLPTPVMDKLTNITLGWTHEVRMKSKVGQGETKDFVVALFLNIPANNCAILQRGDELELLPGGQSVVTNPSVTLRGLFTLGENQLELPTKDIFTRDQVPVSLRLYLKWQLVEPLKLTTHGYNTPYDALKDKTQSILTQIVSHLDYSSMACLQMTTQAMDEMHLAALEYGIVLKDLAVIDRQFKGEIASTMDKLTTRALHTQVEAANVDRENQNRVKQEEGALAVARIKVKSQNALADSQAYSVVAAAKAQAEKTKIEAEAQAHATRMIAEAEAESTRIKASAEAGVLDIFAREMALRRVEVERTKALGNNVIFAPSEPSLGRDMSQSLATGMAANMGARALDKAA
ncbi:band 7 domain-containing protein [Mycena amicta]|nr:band 7 domain-containing protein [Mycena amicta]